MPHPLTSRLLQVLGPTRLLLAGGNKPELLTDLLLAGCDAYAIWLGNVTGRPAPHPRYRQLPDVQIMSGSFDALVVEAKPGTEPLIALLQLFQYTGMPRNLVLAARGHERRKLENGLFLLGWRRHPGSMAVGDYTQLADDVLGEISFYQRIPQEAASRWSIEKLQQDRNLHMDMLRESGCRADAHIVRYALAAQLIRAGDTVVDCACGLGYGSAVMSSLSRAARFLAFDLDPGVIDYATANYAHERLHFAVGDAAALRAIPDASVDMIVSMETIEHVPDWQAVLAEFRRILRPDGRLIASVPDRWVDASGRDPNPYHLHAFDWAKFAQGLQRHFIVEARFLQTAPGGFKLHHASRQLQRVPLDSTIDSEWLLAVASVNPLVEGKARRGDFMHPAFQEAFDESRAPVVGFGTGYDNPYLYRPLVQIGERLMDGDALVHLAQRTIATSDRDSADLGAAITVLGYRVLEEGSASNAEVILERIQAYLADTDAARDVPHVARWRLSLSFLAGRLAALRGDRAQALIWYEATSNLDYQVFSPILATKVVAAAFHAGLLHLVGGDDGCSNSDGGDADYGHADYGAASYSDDSYGQNDNGQNDNSRDTQDAQSRSNMERGNVENARTCFTRGLTMAMAAARSPAMAIIGNLQAPIPFALQEMAEVLDMGSQCAAALNYLPYWAENPGLFWQQIDIKRFGLMAWASDLTRINDTLRTDLQQHVAVNQRLTAELIAARQVSAPASTAASTPAGLRRVGQSA